jgi:hypothetical protein
MKRKNRCWVYKFRETKTGQYKPTVGESTFSTATFKEHLTSVLIKTLEIRNGLQLLKKI